MSVPDTTNFKLSDVVNEITPSLESLQGCFDDAINEEFDPAYGGNGYVGTGTGFDRLSNFRNYGYSGLRWIYLEPYIGAETGRIYRWNDITGTDKDAWEALRDAFYGAEVVLTSYRISGEKLDAGGGDYRMNITRSYLSFDTTLVTQTMISANMVFRIVTKQNTYRIGAGISDHGSPLITEDFSSSFNEFMTKYLGVYSQGDSSEVLGIMPKDSTELYKLNAAIGTVLKVQLKNYLDYVNIVPTASNSVTLWKDGIETGDYIWKPQLRLQYDGVHMLEISSTLWEPDEPADNLYLHLVASEGNNWSATVSTGDTWLTVTAPTSDDGTRIVQINVSTNAGAPRDGTVTFSSTSDDKILTVEQDGIRLTAAPNPWYPNPAGDTQSVAVSTNSTNDWHAAITLGSSWLTYTGGMSGTGNGYFRINTDANNTGGIRHGQVTITSDANNYIVDVWQDPT